MDQRTRSQVVERAGRRCEYCRLPEALSYYPFHVEHIVAVKHGGSDELANLALACRNCNLHKGPNLSGVDPDTEEVVTLYDPRTNAWSDHFAFRGYFIEGKTSKGRATVRVLAVNEEDQLAIREAIGLAEVE